MDIGQATYLNAGLLAKGLKESGFDGLTVLDIDGLGTAGQAGDRESFDITGTQVIVPAPFTGDWDHYNVGTEFGISFNSQGADEDEWIDFDTNATPNSNYLQAFKDLLFYKITVRNNAEAIVPPAVSRIRLYVIQNPFFIVQLNKLLKDIVR